MQKIKVIGGEHVGKTGIIVGVLFASKGILVDFDDKNKDIFLKQDEYVMLEEKEDDNTTNTVTENYIMFNGNKIPITLSEKELKNLGVIPKSPFNRAEKGEYYYCIISRGTVCSVREYGYKDDEELYNVGNYCTDRDLMQKRALHETLHRLLWRFSMENGGYDIDTKEKHNTYEIGYDNFQKKFIVETSSRDVCFTGEIRFLTKEIAERAINEIVLPFMSKHPDYVW